MDPARRALRTFSDSTAGVLAHCLSRSIGCVVLPGFAASMLNLRSATGVLGVMQFLHCLCAWARVSAVVSPADLLRCSDCFALADPRRGVGAPGCGCPAPFPYGCRVPHLSALPLRGRQALRHPADLSNPPGSNPPGRAPDQAVLSVGRSAGGSAGVMSRGGVRRTLSLLSRALKTPRALRSGPLGASPLMSGPTPRDAGCMSGCSVPVTHRPPPCWST